MMEEPVMEGCLGGPLLTFFIGRAGLGIVLGR
jgi:hypothetical protein